MSTPNDGGPAFPLADIDWHADRKHNNGMTLRDYFAAAALQGLLALPIPNEHAKSFYAWDAYQYADAMLAERAKPKESKS